MTSDKKTSVIVGLRRIPDELLQRVYGEKKVLNIQNVRVRPKKVFNFSQIQMIIVA